MLNNSVLPMNKESSAASQSSSKSAVKGKPPEEGIFDQQSFEIQKHLLGSGNFGKVYRAKHKNLGNVVIKFSTIPGSREKIVEERKRKKTSVLQLRYLKHKNVVRVFGIVFGTEIDTYGIVMEEASGGSLHDLLYKTEINVPWCLRFEFFKSIAEGLEYLHYHNPKKCFIHKDLKPENILFDQHLTIKIADLDSYNVCLATGASTSSQIQHTNCCTYLYTAPEILKSLQQNVVTSQLTPSSSSDMYSYGMVGYEIITRCPVFRDPDGKLSLHIDVIVDCIVGGTAKVNESYLNDVENLLENEKNDLDIFRGLRKIIEQCYQYQPEERPTISAVHEDLLQIAESLSFKNISTKEKKSLASQVTKPNVCEDLQVVLETESNQKNNYHSPFIKLRCALQKKILLSTLVFLILSSIVAIVVVAVALNEDSSDCGENEFTCHCYRDKPDTCEKNSTGNIVGCIPESEFLNGIVDCSDRSDERQYYNVVECGSCDVKVYRLNNVAECSNIGFPDCDDATCYITNALDCTQSHCSSTEVICTSYCTNINDEVQRCNEGFQCDDGSLILARQFCDGEQDCYDGSDEKLNELGYECTKLGHTCTLPERNLNSNDPGCNNETCLYNNCSQCFYGYQPPLYFSYCDGLNHCYVPPYYCFNSGSTYKHIKLIEMFVVFLFFSVLKHI